MSSEGNKAKMGETFIGDAAFQQLAKIAQDYIGPHMDVAMLLPGQIPNTALSGIFAAVAERAVGSKPDEMDDVQFVQGMISMLLTYLFQFMPKVARPEFGATGQFPEGKLREDDQGEIKFGVGVSNGNVVLDFGTPVKWLGLPPAQAIELSKMLAARAAEIGNG